MSDDIEDRLRQVTPRGAPPELRPRVLAAVAGELSAAASRPSRRQLQPRPGLAAAAAVLAGLLLNAWVNDTLDRRLAIVLGPPPADRRAAEIATDIASVTDPATGQWAYERLVAGQSRGVDVRQYAVRLQQMIQQATFDWKESAHEAPPQNPQMDRDRHGSGDRHPADDQRLLRLEYRNTA
jgi:hypothetical protein